jgi:hypothetical protein
MLNVVVKIILLGIILQLSICCETRLAQERTKGKSKMEEFRNTEKDILLDVKIESQGNTLQVVYKIINKTEKPIYLFNVLWDFSPSGTYIPDPNSVYSCLRRNGTFALSKQILPLPKTKRVELRLIPFVTKVEANSEFSEKVNVKIPLEEYNPYFPKTDDSKYEVRTTESVVFTIQFIRGSDKLEIKETPLGNALSVWHPDLFGNVETFNSKPSHMEVKVNKRLDAFEEF